MIRAYRIMLCSYEPLSLVEVAEAVSIRSDGTLNPEIFDTERKFWKLKRLCFNFVRFPESTNQAKSYLEFAHDSARLFLLKIGTLDTSKITGEVEFFSEFQNHLEMAKLCISVIKDSNHAIWDNTGPGMCPSDWVKCWEQLERDGALSLEKVLAMLPSQYTSYRRSRSSAEAQLLGE